MLVLLQIFLVLHICGITVLTGTTLVNYILSKQIWSYVKADHTRAIVINSSLLRTVRVTAIGGMITILSGIGMVAILRSAVNSQLWFRIKIILVFLIILNALLVARPQNIRLKGILLTGLNNHRELIPIKTKMNVYYFIQLTILLLIFVLSIFKFN
jgi:hypothetical protein